MNNLGGEIGLNKHQYLICNITVSMDILEYLTNVNENSASCYLGRGRRLTMHRVLPICLLIRKRFLKLYFFTWFIASM